MIPWKRDELVRNFKNNFTTDWFPPSSPNACDEATKTRARTPNLQWSEDGEGNERENRHTGERGVESVAKRWNERSLWLFYPAERVNGSYRVEPVRPVWQTGQTGRTSCARNFAVQTIRVNFRSIRENIQRIQDIDHKEVLVWKFLDQMVKHFQKFIFSNLMC